MSFWKTSLALLWLAGMVLSGCAPASKPPPTEAVLVSSLANDYVTALVESYNRQAQLKIRVQTKQNANESADIYLESAHFLQQQAAQGKLEPVQTEMTDLVPAALKNKQELWCGIFYDPAVLLVNQNFSRRIGQEHLLAWQDVAKLPQSRLVLENLTDSVSTKEFLAAMSARMGQDIFLAYFKQLKPHIIQYAKFPITPVRMVALGDADLAFTRRSYVFKYLENDFPAYMFTPAEGSPVNLYGVGIAKDSAKAAAGKAFLDWLLQSDTARALNLKQRTGYLFILPQGSEGPAVDSTRLWLDTFYITDQRKEQLADTWLKEIRLGTEMEVKR